MTIKLKGSTDGSVSLQAPADTSPTGTDKTFTLPTADGTAGQVLSTNGSGALSFVNAITEVDQWYLTTDLTSDGVLTNLARNNFTGAAQIGTGMSASSGVFTFPSTGKWLILVNAMFSVSGPDSINVLTYVTTNNSTFNLVAFVGEGADNSVQSMGSTCHFLDVTDTSQVKVRFSANSIGTGSYVKGDNTRMETNMIFIRLGDT